MSTTLELLENKLLTLDSRKRHADLEVEHVATANLPTAFGDFKIAAFRNNSDFKDHVIVFKGNISDAEHVLTRIHSECVTGDVFSSRKCDCGEQLNRAMEDIAEAGTGMLVYMRQEGRGIGLVNKVRAYSLQDEGLDTVEANLHLGFDDDLRTYDVAAEMIRLLDPASIQLMTNNPNKYKGMVEAGIQVSERLPIKIMPNKFNQDYLDTKRDKSGHIL